MKIYLATSWRNTDFERARELLRAEGWEVYDFRDSGVNTHASESFEKALSYTEYMSAMAQPELKAQGERDYAALDWCDVVVMLLPCGKSAHIELGYALGAGKPAFVVWSPGPVDLMYQRANVVSSIYDVIDLLRCRDGRDS